MPALTHAEALARAALLTVQRSAVELDLTDPLSPRFHSTTRIEFGCAEPGADTFVEFAPARLLSATLNGHPLPVESLSEHRLPLPGLAPQNTLEVVGEMAYSNDGEGLHRHLDPADDEAYLYAMSFLDAGPRWLASFDQPDLKCPYTMRVRTPEGWTVLGNGRFAETEPGHWQMRQTPPLASYFVTLVAGPYASVRAEHDGIALGLHARRSLAEALERESADILRVTCRAFDAYHELFQRRYAFGDYHQVFVPDFNAGAMENPGCVTLRDRYLFRGSVTAAERAHRAGTIVHELAHQWFGDLVTMSWWDDLWLNESFAELMAHWVCSDFTDYPLWVEFGIQRKDWGAIADQGPATHPVAGNGAYDTQQALAQFDGISYAKGAGVLKQLLVSMTPEVFLTGLRSYFAEFEHRNATLGDLMAAWSGAGAAELADWSAAWLATSGMDTLAVDADGDPETWQIRCRPGAPLERRHAIEVVSLASDASERGRSEIQVGDRPARPTLPEGFWVPDAGDSTWARIRPSAPVEQWPPLARISDSAIRVVLWNSIRDQVRNAELDPAVALRVVCEQLLDEPDEVVVTAVLTWAHGVLAGPYAAPADRPGRLHRLAVLAHQLLQAAEPGSDRQLAAWRGLLRCTDDVELLEGWLSGVSLPLGQELDAELRWSAVWRLATLAVGPAALGRAREAVGEAYALDRSASGRVHRARALASLADLSSKEEAFRLLMHPSELSAYELYAVAEGFFAPEQAQLTEPFVRRFFTGINSTAAFRRGWSLSRLALQAFPASATTRETLDLAEGTLASADLDPRLRRPLMEATDQLRRAVTSLERFAPVG
ncbi:aminopeptidase N [Naumannella sp. ID2617S]|nr:aminopeptidase N [Naumannella sp. ID2617S]